MSTAGLEIVAGGSASPKVPANVGTYSVALPDGTVATFPNSVSQKAAEAILAKQFPPPSATSEVGTQRNAPKPWEEYQAQKQTGAVNTTGTTAQGTPTSNASTLSGVEILPLVAIMCVVLLGPIVGAIALNRKHRRIRPTCKPFVWGYYQALATFFFHYSLLASYVITVSRELP